MLYFNTEAIEKSMQLHWLTTYGRELSWSNPLRNNVYMVLHYIRQYHTDRDLDALIANLQPYLTDQADGRRLALFLANIYMMFTVPKLQNRV